VASAARAVAVGAVVFGAELGGSDSELAAAPTELFEPAAGVGVAAGAGGATGGVEPPLGTDALDDPEPELAGAVAAAACWLVPVASGPEPDPEPVDAVVEAGLDEGEDGAIDADPSPAEDAVVATETSVAGDDDEVSLTDDVEAVGLASLAAGEVEDAVPLEIGAAGALESEVVVDDDGAVSVVGAVSVLANEPAPDAGTIGPAVVVFDVDDAVVGSADDEAVPLLDAAASELSLLEDVGSLVEPTVVESLVVVEVELPFVESLVVVVVELFVVVVELFVVVTVAPLLDESAAGDDGSLAAAGVE
jgi:hypothetical protein